MLIPVMKRLKPGGQPLGMAKVLRCAYPLKMGQGEKAVLGIHGFMGYPGEMYYLAQRLSAEGFMVSIPRLPGHGTCGEDFSKSNREQWLRAVVDEYLNLRSTHEEVFVVGHSMGGLLGLILGEVFPLEKLVLLAPALKVSKPIGAVELLAPFVKRAFSGYEWKPRPISAFLDERDEGDDFHLAKEYWTWSYFKRLRDLNRLRLRGKRSLGAFQGQLLLLLGGKDPAVSVDTVDLVQRRFKGAFEWKVFPEGKHLFLCESEHEEVADLILAWLKGSGREEV